MVDPSTRRWPNRFATPGGFVIDGVERQFVLSEVGAEDHDLLVTWMNDPDVAEFWLLDGPPERTLGYLAELHKATHSKPYIGALDGTPMSYFELYWADLDPLAQHYDAAPYDAGIHLLLGPSDSRGRGLGAQLLRAVSELILGLRPEVSRVVAEPDVRNVRSIAAFERAGFVRSADLDLPDKRAALMIKTREPDD